MDMTWLQKDRLSGNSFRGTSKRAAFEVAQRTRRSRVVRGLVCLAVQWLSRMCRPGGVPIENSYAGAEFIHRSQRWIRGVDKDVCLVCIETN